MKLSMRQLKTDAHEDSLWSCAWTEGPDLLITGSVDETVKAWGASGETCEESHTYTGHSLGVITVAVDPKGLVASSALDSVIRVWDLTTNETKAVLETPPAEVWGIAFNPGESSTHIAAAGGASAAVNVYSLESKTSVSTLSFPTGVDKDKNDKFVLSVAYSPDGQRIAAGAMDGSVAIFDVNQGRLMHMLEGHKMPVRSLAFSPDSKTVVTACDDSHVNMYSVEHASLIGSLSGHTSWVLSVAWNPDGSGFLTGSSDRTVKVWDTASRTCAQTHTQHTDSVWGIAFKPDGTRVASVSDDKAICIFDVAS
uniref:Anaphase-promoting complex subunit 4 WD40 domain-containing protein n=1 Tax=Pyramimonas obovata TaxID=1411642 RepID=A0A7S0RVB2_9CHLO|mmetsp:Transcript_7748/g.15810  ORF Transcript_7748/g.15810 Transcript_7748/m.15810 type:complete len:310 (+) Transcript_7748:248-1177(+)|eukprot:CAMPEP_0118933354 /NCGR_PEP_ID=MMETSP1169-20130426/11944_1 /TAXON_ID=36882 /ORGANISM="Pyramimonas obovata, Strain CCMP722" /LENGTH=309 /DNA_ID=CAMNT_0006876107 /DNA_START=230 /DNA_END=1159 /DNA_ORIENTATION=+